ncbi:MAG: cadherin-like beta sandwich domain-containing protein [Candidatus Thiodiazotropha sp.]
MNNRYRLKWHLIYALALIILLSSCGGGGGSGGSDTTASSDATLSELRLEESILEQTFQTDQLHYSASVAFNQDTITLIPVATSADARIRINDTQLASGSRSEIALIVGQNLINIEVTSADYSTKVTYTLSVTRSPASSDASLSELGMMNADLDQTFQPSQTSYSASVGFLQTRIELSPVTADRGATLLINDTAVSSGGASTTIPLSEGLNLITLVVVAEDGVTSQRYSIEIVRQDAATFAQQGFLKANDATSFNGFGTSVAISDDTLVVGAAWAADQAGAAYVFINDGGSWRQQAYLVASNADGSNHPSYMPSFIRPAGDTFGSSVAISGNTIVVGAPYEDSSANGGEDDNSATYAGAAYVFTRSDGTWSQQAYLKASNAEGANANDRNGDRFGSSVAVSGDTLIVGAPLEDSASLSEDNNTALNAGAVYVFTRSDGIWNQQAYLKANPLDDEAEYLQIISSNIEDHFGSSVAISGDTLIVGAPNEDSSVFGDENEISEPRSGAVYVFSRSNNLWTRQALLKASNSDSQDKFGTYVAISGNTLAVGAPGEASSAHGTESDNTHYHAGAVYIFTRNEEQWNQQARLKASNANTFDLFGSSLAISGDMLVVGAPGEDSAANSGETDDSAAEAGAAYLFTRSDGIWSQQTFLKASNAEADDQFGDAVALSNQTLVVTAPDEDSSTDEGEADNSALSSGAAYIWE